MVKTVGGGRKQRFCGVARNRFWMEVTTHSYNLVRLAKQTQRQRAPWVQSGLRTATRPSALSNSSKLGVNRGLQPRRVDADRSISTSQNLQAAIRLSHFNTSLW